jgi:uncharacterized protein (DUF697 family)
MTTATENTNNNSTKNPLDNRIERLSNAHESVKNYTIGAITIGFIPVPLIDLAALTALQLKMLHSLANGYDVPFRKNLVKSILAPLLGGSAAITIAMPLGSLFKAVPIIGQTSGLISTSAIGAASTYAVGKIFVAHFESGGTFLNFDTEKSKEHFQELYEEGKKFVSSEKTAEVKA